MNVNQEIFEYSEEVHLHYFVFQASICNQLDYYFAIPLVECEGRSGSVVKSIPFDKEFASPWREETCPHDQDGIRY